MNNEEIVQALCQEYGIKTTNKVVRSALLEFTIKYSEKLLTKAKEVSMSESGQSSNPLTVDDLRIAYDLINKTHTPEYEMKERAQYKSLVANIQKEKLEIPEDTLSNKPCNVAVRLPIYGLRNCMTSREYQLGQK